MQMQVEKKKHGGAEWRDRNRKKKLVMQHNAPRAYVNNASAVISSALCNMERVILQSTAEYCVFIAKPRDLRGATGKRAKKRYGRSKLRSITRRVSRIYGDFSTRKPEIR